MATFSQPQIQNDPIYALPHLYISGMNISFASTTVLAIAPGQCRDMNDMIDMPVAWPDANNNINPAIQFQNYQPSLLINSALNGANGLDLGTIAASTQYAIYVIGDSRGYNLVAGLLSLSSNAYPTLPAGYDSLRLIAFIETDSSAHFVYATHVPQSMTGALQYTLSPAVSILSGGNATTFTAVDMFPTVPTGSLPNVIVTFLAVFTPAATGDVYQLRPTGSSATSGLVTVTGIAAGMAQTQYIQVVVGTNGSSHTSVDYLVTSASDSLSLSVASWVGVPHTNYPT